MTKTDFHNNFSINRFIKEDSIEFTDENISKVTNAINKIRPTDRELEATNEILRKLIQRAQFELSITRDKHYYGMQLDGLYIAQAYVDRLLQRP